MRVLRPTSLDEALALLAQAPGDAPLTLAAGCTDLLVSWHHRPKDDLTLLDLSSVLDFTPLRLTEDWLELGAMTSYWEVMQRQELAEEFPLLGQAARQVGAIQIQTRGTWAGNIANGSPAADGVPVLMAYDAVVVLQSRSASTEVPLDAFYTGYRQSVRRSDQLITGIRVPRRPRKKQWFHKVGARSAQAIAKVGVAVVQDDRGWRVVASSVAPVVLRCRHLEQALDAGQAFADPDAVRSVLMNDIAPIDDIRSTADYRATALSRLIWFWLQECRAVGQAGASV